MSSEYVEQRDGAFYVAGTRVMLDSVVLGFQNGNSAETIHENFPTLSLEQVYGVIACYLRNRDKIDAAMRERERFEDEFKSQYPAPISLTERLERERIFARRR
jgi:uncharacterized protein (DUF433 family)